MSKTGPIIKIGTIQQRILLIRGEKVIIDADLAQAYGVTTKALNQAVRRNAERFDTAVFKHRLMGLVSQVLGDRQTTVD